LRRTLMHPHLLSQQFFYEVGTSLNHETGRAQFF
jgi:hypothetical protein